MAQTSLHNRHVALGAKMVDFSGWEMPLHYGSQLQEHHEVRRCCGLFDVSHMGIIDLLGEGGEDLLQRLLACDVARLPVVEPGDPVPGAYGLMLNDRGNVADDLILFRLKKGLFSLVVNASTRKKDLAWLRAHAPSFGVQVVLRQELAILALQGPKAPDSLEHALPSHLVEKVAALRPFQMLVEGGWRVARTGYTGEDGFELMFPAEWSERVWNGLLRGEMVSPVGLGARDTLRLEAGLNLYGTDMDEKHNPLESGVAWTIDWEPESRDFIGRAALKKWRYGGVDKKRVGLILQDKGVLRNQQKVLLGGKIMGEITSGGYSPTLGKGIALARVASHLEVGGGCQVEVRGRHLEARIVSLPFVKRGVSVWDGKEGSCSSPLTRESS
ncbi:MAG: glycine cleavage system aminomethyltransferase GcvT [Magnetococcales bacterium]|nr:glycine cleavage system aminomethyltransferase GcvT [Magnetococcales bacterium]